MSPVPILGLSYYSYLNRFEQGQMSQQPFRLTQSLMWDRNIRHKDDGAGAECAPAVRTVVQGEA